MNETPTEPRSRMLPPSYPLWAELLASTAVLTVVGLIAGYLVVSLIMEWNIDALGWVFVGAAALFGGGLGAWNASPERAQRILAEVGRAAFIAFLGYILVDSQELSYKRSAPRGPAVAVLGMCVLFVGGAILTARPLRRDPRDKWDVVSAFAIALAFAVALVFAVMRLVHRYG